MSTTLYPEVIDTTTIAEVFAEDQFLEIGVEGRKDTAGTADIATVYTVTRKSQADTLFGPSSSLATLIKFLFDRGIAVVRAVASKDNAAPLLADRQDAWALLEENKDVRIRLTDSTAQADLVALADSCEWAEGIQNKQFCIAGMASGTSKAALISAATAINSKRAVLVGPGIYDQNGNLLGGPFSSAWVAAEVSKNPDIADDLDTMLLPGSTGIEQAANGQPLLREKAGAGTPVNDFEDLLQGGVSPLRQGRRGGAEITHLRMTYTADSTFDALMTRLVADQLFVDIRTLLEDSLALRRPNTAEQRLDIGALVNRYLQEAINWVKPRLQPDGKIGFGVAVTATTDGRGIKVHYIGTIVRNTQNIDINGQLVIPA